MWNRNGKALFKTTNRDAWSAPVAGIPHAFVQFHFWPWRKKANSSKGYVNCLRSTILKSKTQASAWAASNTSLHRCECRAREREEWRKRGRERGVEKEKMRERSGERKDDREERRKRRWEREDEREEWRKRRWERGEEKEKMIERRWERGVEEERMWNRKKVSSVGSRLLASGVWMAVKRRLPFLHYEQNWTH